MKKVFAINGAKYNSAIKTATAAWDIMRTDADMLICRRSTPKDIKKQILKLNKGESKTVCGEQIKIERI